MDRMLDKALGEDATTLATAEKQLLLSRLLARLAHEIRNPLSSLDIHVQLLEEDLSLHAAPLRPAFEGRLEIIRGELRRLENIVKQFLRLAGPSSLELDQVEIEAVLRHICDLLQPELDRREIELSKTLEQPLPALQADVSQLTQALLNLVINAIQAIDRKGKITLRASPSDDCLKISVADTGPGIPPADLSAIFEPYFTTKPDGSGLGLWIAQQIAMAHGGAIQAANAPAGGAVFTLQLPLKPKQPRHEHLKN